MSCNQKIPVIMGPTASGKSSLAMFLAEKLEGEIVSVDSMQLYKGLDIGTAKPTLEERQRVPHHLIDICSFDQRLNVYQFVETAGQAIDNILHRGKLPILCGGTGLYFKALLYGLDPLPGDAKLRAELDVKYDNEAGFADLKDLMSRIDAADYKRWQSHRRKLIRALEVFTLTGKSITELQTIHQPELRFPVAARILIWDREKLRNRIALRTGIMLESGWIEEAEKAIAAGILSSPTAHQAIGYRIIGRYLKGEIDYDKMKELIITGTWQYARRQLTWFNRQHPEAEKIVMPIDNDAFLLNMKNCFMS
jgi:tRNA dimethylallyltransferase